MEVMTSFWCLIYELWISFKLFFVFLQLFDFEELNILYEVNLNNTWDHLGTV